jgi:hypothetical protein
MGEGNVRDKFRPAIPLLEMSFKEFDHNLELAQETATLTEASASNKGR